MKTAGKKTITIVFVLFIALFLTSQSGFAQYNKVERFLEKYYGFKQGIWVNFDAHFKNNIHVNNDININPGEGKGIKFWKSDQYKINMGNSYKHHYGPVTGYSIKNSMNNTEGRGWVWGINNSSPIMALSNRGHMQIAKTLAIGSDLVPNTVLTVDGRTYISEVGGNETGFNSTTSNNYKDYLLWVEEGIVSADFAIAEVNNWPDYVFNKNYNLRSLKEVEKNIKENGHLHTMPSAKEVAENGFTVKDITKRVVKTIEELTLHTIAQEKQIAALMDRLARLEQMLENKGK
tara:strand:+ start:4331 stop:5200 length:870 start_codon:yes stop_codon:yes gene_type:complete